MSGSLAWACDGSQQVFTLSDALCVPTTSFQGSSFHSRCKELIENRQNQQNQHGCGEHASDDNPRQGLLRLGPDAGRDRSREEPDGGRQGGHQDRPHLDIRPLQDGLLQGEPGPSKITDA